MDENQRLHGYDDIRSLSLHVHGMIFTQFFIKELSLMYTVFLLKKTTTAKKLLHIPHILPHTSDCAKLLLIVQNDSVLFTEWERKRSPPRWTSDYVIEEPIEESIQPWTGRTRSGRHVNPLSRFIADESPSFAASAITPYA